jgi:hypothetical protein
VTSSPNAYDQTINCQPWTPPKHEKEDDESSIDLSIFDKENDKSYVDLKMFDTEDSKSSELDHCCHHIKKMSTSIQIFSVRVLDSIVRWASSCVR